MRGPRPCRQTGAEIWHHDSTIAHLRFHGGERLNPAPEPRAAIARAPHSRTRRLALRATLFLLVVVLGLPLLVQASSSKTSILRPRVAVPTKSAPTRASLAVYDVSPPVEVFFEPLDPVRPGGTARFHVSVIPRFPADEVRIDVRTAPAISWVSGPRSTRRLVHKDGRTDIEFSVRVPTTGRHPLHVAIEALGPGGVVWRRGVGLGLGPNPRADRARVVPDGRGGQALEFEAAPAEPGRALREESR